MPSASFAGHQFLWELKMDPAPKLTEGQMISSWNATDTNKNGSVTLEEFRAYVLPCSAIPVEACGT